MSDLETAGRQTNLHDDEALRLARLRVEVLARGIRLAPALRQDPSLLGKPALRVRSGSCGGIDLVLPDGSLVNAPYRERFTASSPLTLDLDEDGYGLWRMADDGDREPLVSVDVVPEPAYYSRTGTDGVPLQRVGQLCSDRLGIGLTNHCTYWSDPETRCKFCSIGLNTDSEQRNKRNRQILEVVDAAFSDPVQPARHVLLGGGTPDGDDAGARRIADVAGAIKGSRPKCRVYAMISPPQDLSAIDRLHSAGIDELGVNVELYDQDAAMRYAPGKTERFGVDGYMSVLERAVGRFGPINTRSILIVGLEPPESTVAGAERLASLGVMPILTPFRPMVGTELEHHAPFSPDLLWEICNAATEAAASHGIPLGPTCIPCQANTLNIPGHPAYRHY